MRWPYFFFCLVILKYYTHYAFLLLHALTRGNTLADTCRTPLPIDVSADWRQSGVSFVWVSSHVTSSPLTGITHTDTHTPFGRVIHMKGYPFRFGGSDDSRTRGISLLETRFPFLSHFWHTFTRRSLLHDARKTFKNTLTNTQIRSLLNHFTRINALYKELFFSWFTQTARFGTPQGTVNASMYQNNTANNEHNNEQNRMEDRLKASDWPYRQREACWFRRLRTMCPFVYKC